MEDNNRSQEAQDPKNSGKVPASGVMSETYKEEANPQDKLGSSSNDPRDPEEPDIASEDDLDSYPLEEADESAERNIDEEDNTVDTDSQDIHPSTTEDEFLK